MFDADKDYAEACNPDRWTILGLKLKHFCRGHLELLTRINSPCVNEQPVGCADLVLALLICSRTYERGQEFIASKFTFRQGAFAQFVAAADAISGGKFVYKRAEALGRYIQEAERLPTGIFWPQPKAGEQAPKRSYAPSALSYLKDLTEGYNLTFSQVMNMPLRQAAFLRYKLLESDGLLNWRMRTRPAPKETEAANG